MCFRAYKSAIEILVAKPIRDIIIASGMTSKNRVRSGNCGDGKPIGIEPTIARL